MGFAATSPVHQTIKLQYQSAWAPPMYPGTETCVCSDNIDVMPNGSPILPKSGAQLNKRKAANFGVLVSPLEPLFPVCQR